MARSQRTEVDRRELALVILGACLLAVVMTWPLVLHLGDTIPKDLGDPLPQAWQIAWGGHALGHQPLELFQANQFWPEKDSLAFGDALIGYSPLGLIGSGPHDAVLRYDIAFIVAYALAFAGAYLLARELGVSRAGATVAGVAFAFAPFRLEQDGHMQVISSGGIPLALALGIRGIRTFSPGLLFAGWAVAAWQLSMGFAIGLPFAYTLGFIVLIWVVVWFWRNMPPVDRSLLIAGALGAILFVVVAGLIARPYFRVADDHPEAKRPPSTVEAFSGPLSVFATAPDESLVWGEATADIRNDLENVPEKTLFPGLVIVLLAMVGLGSTVFPRWLRITLVLAVLIWSALALGFKEDDGWLWPYRVVYDVLPGFDGIRTPGRLVTFSSLALALLAAAGAQSILEAVRHWLAGRRVDVGPRGAAALPAILAVLLVAGIAVEGRGLPFDPLDDRAQPEVPDVPPAVADVQEPQLHLPAGTPEDNRRYLLWSTDGFPDIVNGRASTNPDDVEELIADMDGFPDRDTIARLRAYGVRSVIVHTDRVPDSVPSAAYPARAAALGLSVERRGELLVYGLRSSAGSAGDG